MEDINKIKLFEETPVPKAVMKLAVPTIIGCLVTMLYNLADTYFVGMLNDPIQNAAVTLSAPVLLAFNAVNNLFGVGASSMMSRALGRKDFDTARKSSAFGFYSALFSGILFSVLCTVLKDPLMLLLGTVPENTAQTGSYMFWTVTCGAAPAILNIVMGYLVRAEGSALHASIGTMSGCILNIILDPLFILPWGLGMGSAGAGCATFISNCAACAYFFVLLYVKRKNTYVCLSPKYFSISGRIAMGICGVGIPAAIQNLLNVTGMTILNNFTADFSSDAVAAMGIAQKISMIPMYAAMGLSQGIMPLISYNYASGNSKRMKKTLIFSAELSIAFLAAASVGYYIGAEKLVSMFMENGVIVGYGSRFLRGFCIATPFLAMDFLAVGVFQACGMGKKSFIFAVMRKIILEIPALYILNYFFPLYGLAYAQFAAEVVLAAAAVVSLISMFKRLDGNGNGNRL
ncbi:MAG: MATE family efflux transporter [Oscillospiraceae bacterium]